MKKPLDDNKKKLLKEHAGSASSPIVFNDIREALKVEELNSSSRTVVDNQKAIDLSAEVIYYKALIQILGNVKDAFHDMRPEADPMKNLARIKRIAEYALEFHDKEK